MEPRKKNQLTSFSVHGAGFFGYFLPSKSGPKLPEIYRWWFVYEVELLLGGGGVVTDPPKYSNRACFCTRAPPSLANPWWVAWVQFLNPRRENSSLTLGPGQQPLGSLNPLTSLDKTNSAPSRLAIHAFEGECWSS